MSLCVQFKQFVYVMFIYEDFCPTFTAKRFFNTSIYFQSEFNYHNGLSKQKKKKNLLLNKFSSNSTLLSTQGTKFHNIDLQLE